MNADNLPGDGTDNRSRFAYITELEPTEGGVKPVAEASPERATPKHSRGNHVITAGINGIPAAGDRLLDISEIARTLGQYYKHTISIPHRDGDELDFVEPITGEVVLTNSGDALILRGQVKTVLRLECARCLQTVLTPVETSIEEEFDLVGETSAWGVSSDVTAVDGDENGAVIKGNVLDLGDLLRQYLTLAAPTWVECADKCAEIPLPEGVVFKRLEPGAEEPVPASADSPLKHLAELLAEKERRGNN
ncbi:MAG: DUF177 domain-containing protein [Armatimonadetes bacterium]|nr:DUF177 domain-containing protein [Armatimonadota bacterium]